MAGKRDILLQATGLTTGLRTRSGTVTVVNQLDLTLRAGETLAVVGESGSGKSMMALSLMRLLPEGVAHDAGGQVQFGGRDLLRLPEREMESMRGNAISMIFQEPMTSLNPVLRIGRQLQEVLEEHRPQLSAAAAKLRTMELLRMVRIADPERVLGEFAHRLSGGMRQRVMIAMALACDPQVLIADEPTTALDATVQAQILDLLRGLQAESGLAILLITHNLGVVAGQADRVMVMYAGRTMEEAPVADLFRTPLHPYTAGLLAALPNPHHSLGAERLPLREIPGLVPSLDALPPGCAFAPRCPRVMPICHEHRPALDHVAPDRRVACFAAMSPV